MANYQLVGDTFVDVEFNGLQLVGDTFVQGAGGGGGNGGAKNLLHELYTPLINEFINEVLTS